MMNVLMQVKKKDDGLQVIMEGERDAIPYVSSSNDWHLTLTLNEREAVCLFSDLMDALYPHGGLESGAKSTGEMAELILKEHLLENYPVSVIPAQVAKHALVTVSFAMVHDRIKAGDYWKQVATYIREKFNIPE